MQEPVQSRAGRGREFLAGVVDPEENAAILPPREGQAAKTKPHFAGLRRSVQRDRRRRQDGVQRGPRLIEQRFRFAIRDEPGIQVARAAGIDLFEDVQRGLVLVKLHVELRVQGGETVRDGAAAISGKNQAQAGDRSPATRLARAPEPEQSEREAIVYRVR